jgi:hypothetical protein
MFNIGGGGDASRAAITRWYIDLAIGAGGSEQIIMSNFLATCGTGVDMPFITGGFLLPFFIPAGTRIAARAQCNVNTAGDRTFDMNLWGFEP